MKDLHHVLLSLVLQLTAASIPFFAMLHALTGAYRLPLDYGFYSKKVPYEVHPTSGKYHKARHAPRGTEPHVALPVKFISVKRGVSATPGDIGVQCSQGCQPDRPVRKVPLLWGYFSVGLGYSSRSPTPHLRSQISLCV